MHFFQRDPEQSWATIRKCSLAFWAQRTPNACVAQCRASGVGRMGAAGAKVVITQNILTGSTQRLAAAIWSRPLSQHDLPRLCQGTALDHTTTRETVPRCDCGDGSAQPDFIFFGGEFPVTWWNGPRPRPVKPGHVAGGHVRGSVSGSVPAVLANGWAHSSSKSIRSPPSSPAV